MLEQFLHEQLEIAFNFGIPKPEMPESITQNLNPAFERRHYQEDAFASLIHYLNTDLPGKKNRYTCCSTQLTPMVLDVRLPLKTQPTVF